MLLQPTIRQKFPLAYFASLLSTTKITIKTNALCSVHCTLHSVLCTLQSLLCNPYSVLCTLCSVLCTRCLWVLFNKVSSFIIRSYIYIHTCQWYVWLIFLLTQSNMHKVSSCIDKFPFLNFHLSFIWDI